MALDEVALPANAATATNDDPYYTGSVVGDARRGRPVGIAVLAVLHFGGGILLGAMQLFMLPKLDEFEEPLRSAGLSPLLLLIGITFLALLGIAAAIGMWFGRKWGWWLATFYYVYAMARNIWALVLIARLHDDLGNGGRGPEDYYFKHLGRIVVHALILVYFFRANVLSYFGLERLSKWTAMTVLVWACLVVCGMVAVIGWLIA